MRKLTADHFTQRAEKAVAWVDGDLICFKATVSGYWEIRKVHGYSSQFICESVDAVPIQADMYEYYVLSPLIQEMLDAMSD